jgi:hypothetical protein
MKQIWIYFIILIFNMCTLQADTVVEDALLSKTDYTLMGTFGQHDFAEKESAFDWAFTMLSSGKSYQLQGNNPSDNDVFGWKEVTIETPQAAWYMFQLSGDVDGDGSSKFDWVLVSTNLEKKAAYKLAGVASNGTFQYSEKLNIDYYISGTSLTTGPPNSLTEEISTLLPRFVIKTINAAYIDFEFDIDIGNPIKPRVHYYYTLNGKNDISVSDIKAYSPVWKAGNAAIRVVPNTKVKVLAVLYADDNTKSFADAKTSVSEHNEKLMSTSIELSTVSFIAVAANTKVLEENSWSIRVEGSNAPYSYSILWGDLSSDNGVLDQAADFSATHTYAESGNYTITVNITDSEGGVTSISTQTNVTASLSTPTISGPTTLILSEAATWSVNFEGGIAPYKASVNWGDTSATQTYTSNSNAFSLSHTYTQSGTYMFSVTLTDSEGATQSKNYSVSLASEVLTPLSISAITGSTQLQREETGTWTVQLNGGTAPFEAYVNWNDNTSTEPYSSSNRVFTISHGYAQYGSYTFNVAVTDAAGISHTKNHTVVLEEPVPLEAPSFTYTLDTTCTDALGSSTGQYTGTITRNSDNTLSITGSDNQVFTTSLTGDAFSYSQTILSDPVNNISVTDVFAGTVTLDSINNILTGSGTHTLEVSDGSLSCTGTWSSD